MAIKRISMSQAAVARAAKVSRSTVSMVFTGKGRVAEATRQRVLRAAQELGYHPDLNIDARRMGARNSGEAISYRVLGLIWNIKIGSPGINSFYGTLLDGLMEACYERNQTIMLLNVKIEELQNLSFLSRLDGLIMPAVSPPYLEAARRLGKPIVTILAEIAGVADVGIDNAEAVRVAFSHLYEKGHRAIGFISMEAGGEYPSQPAQRWTSYCACLQNAGLPYRKSHVFLGSEVGFRAQGALGLRQIWAEEIRPTACVVYNDTMALGVLDAATELGIAIPEELSIVSIDDIPAAANTEPPLSTVAIDIEGMGRRAVLLLEEFARTGEYRPARIQMELKLHERASVRRLA